MDWITLILGLISGGGIASLVIAWNASRKVKPEISLLKSEASENITEAAQVAVNILERALTFKASENASLRERVQALEDSQKELQSHRDERAKQIETLTRQTEELQEANEAQSSKIAALEMQIKKDTEETEALRGEVETLRKQIAEGAAKYDALKRYTQKLVKSLEDAKIPLPDFNGDSLTDTLSKIKKVTP